MCTGGQAGMCMYAGMCVGLCMDEGQAGICMCLLVDRWSDHVCVQLLACCEHVHGPACVYVCVGVQVDIYTCMCVYMLEKARAFLCDHVSQYMCRHMTCLLGL